MSIWRQDWSKADEDRLIELVAKPGVSVAWLAHEFKRPMRAITLKMYNLGISFPRPTQWTDDRVERLKTLWAQGYTASQIAAMIGGVTRNGVLGKVHRLGIADRQPRNQSEATSMANRRPAKPKKPAQKKIQKPMGNPTIRALFAEPEPMEPVEEIYVPPEERKTLQDLERDDCRWPIGDVGTPEFHFCNRNKVDGLPYCEHHSRRAFQPPNVKRGPFVLESTADAVARKNARKEQERETEAA